MSKHCEVCNGSGYESAGEGMYGVWECTTCGGSGKSLEQVTKDRMNWFKEKYPEAYEKSVKEFRELTDQIANSNPTKREY